MRDICKKYNTLITRFKKAEVYMNDNSKTIEQREKYGNAYLDIINNLNKTLIKLIGCKDCELTGETILNGFKEDV